MTGGQQDPRPQPAAGGRVDVHSHYLPGALAQALERRTEAPCIQGDGKEQVIVYGAGNVHPMLPAFRDLELRLRDMDEQGIELAVLGVNVPGLDWFPAPDGSAIARAVNDELLELAGAHPGRLAAMAALPLQAPQDAAAELERAIGRGAVGAMIYSNVAGRPLDEPELEPVLATAARLDVPLFIHPTYPLVAGTLDAYALIPTLGFLVDTTTAALRLVLGGLYERHPHFKLVLAHAGSLLPQLAGRVDYEAARDPNGYGRLSAPPGEQLRLIYTDAVCVWPPALHSALALCGPERLMLGTDYPFWEPRRTLETLAAAQLPDDVTAAVNRHNARRLFALEPATSSRA